ncbi:Uncharacterised protein [Yersinia mollaretii]|uniref:Uncharacterized protein n=1 Tax=Yersinia mollaretii TaxID=33060 RepID=A0AA36LQ65_YERMO|nr:Uncharacterised protein [Yersinia mollaretii]
MLIAILHQKIDLVTEGENNGRIYSSIAKKTKPSNSSSFWSRYAGVEERPALEAGK